MIKKIIIIFIIALVISSCYIESSSNDNTEKTALSINLPIPEEMMKAPSSGYYFEVYLYPAEGDEIFREIALGSFDPYNGGGGGVFPVVITDIPEGLYTDLNIRYYLVGDGLQYLDNGIYEFTITKGENTIVNVVIGPFF